MIELDEPGQPDTYRAFVRATTLAIAYARAYWGRRFFGTLGIYADMIAEGVSQAIYARLPGHPEQAPDSLERSGIDRGLVRFRGETAANWVARVRSAWNDYEQGGTPPQVLRIVNQWGQAGWPGSWNSSLVTLVESGNPLDFSFTITIPFGLIAPAWTPELYGSGHAYGESGFYYGIAASSDVAMLVYIVNKWKPQRSRAYVRIYYSVSAFVTLVV